MASDEVFSISSELPPVVSSSLDGDKELQDSFAARWEAVDAAEAERAAKSPSPEAPEPPVAIEPTESSTDTPHADQPTTTVRTEYGSSTREIITNK
jgi:hypothetical protein